MQLDSSIVFQTLPNWRSSVDLDLPSNQHDNASPPAVPATSQLVNLVMAHSAPSTSTALSIAASDPASSKKRSREDDPARRALYDKCLQNGPKDLERWTRPQLHAVLWALGEDFHEVKIGDAREIIRRCLEGMANQMPTADQVPLRKKARSSSSVATGSSASSVAADGCVLGGNGDTGAFSVAFSHLSLASLRWGAAQQIKIAKALVEDIFTVSPRLSSQIEVVCQRGARWSLLAVVRGLFRFDDGTRPMLPSMLTDIEARQLHSFMQLLSGAAGSMQELQACGGSSLFLLPVAVVAQDFLHDVSASRKALDEALRFSDTMATSSFDSSLALAFRCRILSRIGSVSRLQKNFQQALQYSLEAYQQLQMRFRGTRRFQGLRGSCTTLLGVSLRCVGSLAESCERLYEAMAQFEGLPDDHGLEWATTELIRTLVTSQKLQEAELLCQNLQHRKDASPCTRFQDIMQHYECVKEQLYVPRELHKSADQRDREQARTLLMRASKLLQTAEQFVVTTGSNCSCHRSHHSRLEYATKLMSKISSAAAALRHSESVVSDTLVVRSASRIRNLSGI